MNSVTIPTSSTSTSPLPTKWIEKLFDKMLLDYGKKFVDQWVAAEPDKLIAHWAQELASFSREELARGYNALEGRDWTPSLPEFKKLCRPPVDPMVAYYEAVSGMQARERGEMGAWSHPAIFWAAVDVSAVDLLEKTYSQVKNRWEAALKEQMERGSWPSIPARMVALPAPGKTEMTAEEADKRIKELHAQGVMKSADEKTDHRRWAKKIQKRLQAGDKSVPAIAQKWAKDELGYSA